MLHSGPRPRRDGADPDLSARDRKARRKAGPAPFSRGSGQRKGRSFISGGRKPLRDALCMPAVVAMRCSPGLKAKRTQLREAGKPAKVALVAPMRKLQLTANALVEANRLWTPKATCARRILTHSPSQCEAVENASRRGTGAHRVPGAPRHLARTLRRNWSGCQRRSWV
ncbi:transposase [Mangrovicoccus sp. HB161399]|uniref:transposase n=1 Tax=Mangrovicoccus sp. HB161399 TaxID=2720392 RepID=UPI00155301EE